MANPEMENWEIILKNKSIIPINNISRKKNCITITFSDNNVYNFSINDIQYFLLYTKFLSFKLMDNIPETFSSANEIEKSRFKIIGVKKGDIVQISDNCESITLVF